MIEIIAMGRLTRDAETKVNKNGKECLEFSVAVDVGYGDNKETQFITCDLYGKPGMQKVLKKGAKVMVMGECKLKVYNEKVSVFMTVDKVEIGEFAKTIEEVDTSGFKDIQSDDIPF